MGRPGRWAAPEPPSFARARLVGGDWLTAVLTGIAGDDGGHGAGAYPGGIPVMHSVGPGMAAGMLG